MGTTQPTGTRLSIEMSGDARRRIRRAAAKRKVSMRRYVLEAVQAQLSKEAESDRAAKGSMLALTAQTDPVLAHLWNNSKDAAYDRL